MKKQKKDCLFLGQFFYPEYISSATLPFDTARALHAAGYTVGALCGYPYEYAGGEQPPLRETVAGVDIQRVRYIHRNKHRFFGRLTNYFSLTFRMFLRLPKMRQYRTVIVYSNPPILPWVASFARVLFGTKLIFVAYDVYPEIAIRTHALRPRHMISRLMDHINRVVYRRAERVVALSEEMRAYILQHRKIDPARVITIPNWYEDRMATGDVPHENAFASLVSGRFVVSYFGNMGVAQDMETVMQAMRCLKDDPTVCFLFAGYGTKQAALRDMIAQENIPNAYVYDFLQGEQFQDALRISDCTLISLVEGVADLCAPSKTYSYMMRGIPLMAIMGRCDIVQDCEAGAGMWFANGEGEKLAAGIRAMQQDPAMQQRMRTVCRSLYLQKYTTARCTAQYVDMMRTLLSAPQGEADSDPGDAKNT